MSSANDEAASIEAALADDIEASASNTAMADNSESNHEASSTATANDDQEEKLEKKYFLFFPNQLIKISPPLLLFRCLPLSKMALLLTEAAIVAVALPLLLISAHHLVL